MRSSSVSCSVVVGIGRRVQAGVEGSPGGGRRGGRVQRVRVRLQHVLQRDSVRRGAGGRGVRLWRCGRRRGGERISTSEAHHDGAHADNNQVGKLSLHGVFLLRLLLRAPSLVLLPLPPPPSFSP
jgi:hypothetical protein